VTVFDTYVVVDWSASGRPVTGADSIWIASVDRFASLELANPATRSAAERRIRDLVVGASADRTLLAIDVGLGYPAGSAELFGLSGTPWASMWAAVAGLLHDADDNRNNRFAVAAALNGRTSRPGPFWGCPAGEAGPHLATRRPRAFAVDELRLTERRLREAGLQPKSVWQLAYSGSVGSQTLTAIPLLDRLRRSLPDRVSVWPFGGADRPPTVPGSVVVAEVYPSAFPVEVPAGWVRDAAQVATVARALADADRSGELGEWFGPPLDPAERSVVEAEEGWVLGPAGGRPVR
jgi:hypothetical protein